MELNISPLNLMGVDSDQRPLVISGPCSAETEEQVMESASQLSSCGIRVFRAGVWKPRTKPGGFEGRGEIALPWLKRVHDELGMLVATEVATSTHVESALNYGVDILWVGARTVANPFAVQEIADALRGVDVPVLVKNPVNPDLELWLGGMQRINRAGITRMAAVHRGFSSYDKRLYRNPPMWHIPIELRRRIPELPIFIDPSHISGRRELIAPLCQQAMDLGFDGIMVESHSNPDVAWSDAKQQIKPEVLADILTQLKVRTKMESTEELQEFRRRIDECDNALLELLARRMDICREIGEYKKEHNMQVVQTLRYTEILDKRSSQGIQAGMSQGFIRDVFEHIHEESVNQQIEIINKK